MLKSTNERLNGMEEAVSAELQADAQMAPAKPVKRVKANDEPYRFPEESGHYLAW